MTALRGWCTSPPATANPPFQSRQAQLESGVRGNVPAPFGAGERLQSPTYRYPLLQCHYLVQLTGPQRRDGRLSRAALFKQVSPVAWQHINLHGRYEFRKSPEAIYIDAIVQELSQLPITQDMDD